MLTAPQNLADNVSNVRLAIAAAAHRSGRDAASVCLIAVTKGHAADAVRAAATLGIEDFGENYLQEAVAKIDACGREPVRWHFIGALQSNKTRVVAERFDWVHTVDRLRIAERLAAQRPYHAPPLNVCLQVNLGAETTKAGVHPGELPGLASAVGRLERLRLRGLMCIPPAETDPERQRHWFRLLRRLRDDLVDLGVALDVLSMGMSGDFAVAIEEGATHVRVGTALFGPRDG
jgi:pyridoxal phosphate enzyme (YggS family)